MYILPMHSIHSILQINIEHSKLYAFIEPIPSSRQSKRDQTRQLEGEIPPFYYPKFSTQSIPTQPSDASHHINIPRIPLPQMQFRQTDPSHLKIAITASSTRAFRSQRDFGGIATEETHGAVRDEFL